MTSTDMRYDDTLVVPPVVPADAIAQRLQQQGEPLPPVDQTGPDYIVGDFERITTDKPRRVRSFGVADRLELAVSAVAGFAVSSIVFTVMDWDGLVGRFLFAIAAFLLIYRVLVGETQGAIVATDRVMTVLITLGSMVSVAALGWLVVYVFLKGLPELRPGFFTETMESVGPLDDGGGAFHALIGTLQQVGIASAIAVPAAILTAIYLHEIKGRMAPLIRFFVDAMSGLPSIVAGLLVYTIWILQFGRGFSGMAAAVALTILMLPTVTRAAEEILRTVPDTLREASLALGAPQWRVVLRVVLPTASSGLVTAAILGVARAIGETAPILLTASYSSSLNTNPLDGKQASLPMFVFQLVRQPNKTQLDRAWTGALVLLMTILVLFTMARYVSARGRKKRGMR
jgi:phosphate transport system permease protein